MQGYFALLDAYCAVAQRMISRSAAWLLKYAASDSRVRCQDWSRKSGAAASHTVILMVYRLSTTFTGYDPKDGL